MGMEQAQWTAVRGVVAGRLINCYAWNDWMLALLYRSKSYEIGVAGLYPIVLNAPHISATHAHAHHITPHVLLQPHTVHTVHTVHHHNTVPLSPSENAPAALASTPSSGSGSAEVLEANAHATFAAHEGTQHIETTSSSSSTSSAAQTVQNQSGHDDANKPARKHSFTYSAFEVENCDVSHLINSHSDYPNVLPAIVAMLKL